MEEKRRPDLGAHKFSAGIDLLFMTFLWLLSLVIINPIGDFPLNDDWSYGITVKHFMETGEFRPCGWTAMTLISHVLWGSLFCRFTEFSFNVLRLSTLIMSWLGIIGTYFLVKQLYPSRRLAILAAMMVGFNPLYYALSSTFMTDVTFTTIMVYSVMFFMRHLKNDSNVDGFVGILFAVAAALSRQIAVAIPFAFAVTLILKRGITKKNVLRAAIPSLVCVGVLLGFQHWLEANARITNLYYSRTDSLLETWADPLLLISHLARNAYIALFYLGLFLMPVLIGVMEKMWRSNRKKTAVIFIASLGVLAITYGIAALYCGYVPKMPLVGNTIVQSGIGPLTLCDNIRLLLNPVVTLPVGFWVCITGISMLGAACLLSVVVYGGANIKIKLSPAGMTDNEAMVTFVILSVVFYTLPIFSTGLFDRYLIPVLPLLCVACVGIASNVSLSLHTNSKGVQYAAVAILAGLSLYAIAGTRDYLAWNRCRWNALNDLMTKVQVKAQDIDGGFEFNGYYLYHPQYKNIPGKSWWWVYGDSFRIGFNCMPNYKVIKEYHYYNWMPPHDNKIVVMMFDPAATQNHNGPPAQ